MLFLLDTNAVIALLNAQGGLVSQRIRQYRPADIGLPSIVMHELYFGAFRSQRLERNLALVDRLRFEVVPFDQDDARRAGEIRAALAAQGTPIGGYDVLIAGQASARGLTLVSRNVREFARVESLRVENWEGEI
ncbi:type II toxin-antitoxin system VapC family toxin [Thiomonas bhubaneswarensis]|uniref:Ribonuclease VapC n=1 Tax=Thiomonas bhubaneswarensis TaxID=339866 RepID=A0A0K6HP57_9BURK|nr:type II toxin-antitoxin system VapC family toxin [Thiomonas bhubaneswarensis]CUA92832.1 Predicted nucleic acid-binding protein, contains PIN domain [Thiomonas bhubaneswarensis]